MKTQHEECHKRRDKYKITHSTEKIVGRRQLINQYLKQS